MTEESLSHEHHTFPPDPAFAAQANGTAPMYADADADYEGFWAAQARDRITWSKDFTTTLDWSDAPFAKWYVGGELNAAYKRVDRHVENGLGDRVAIHFEGEPGDTRTITYADLQRDVCKVANALESLGVAKGDTVAIYLPMIPEAVVAMLACARIGAPALVVFGGFSAEALNTRINDAQQVRHHRRRRVSPGNPSALRLAVDAALDHADTSVEKVHPSSGAPARMSRGTTARPVVGRHRRPAADTHEAVPHDSEHPLFILTRPGPRGNRRASSTRPGVI